MSSSFIILFSLLTTSFCLAQDITPQTLAEAEAYTPEELQAYRQSKYSIDDPAGDYALLKRSELVPLRIFKTLTGNKKENGDNPPLNKEDYEIELEDTNVEVPGTAVTLTSEQSLTDQLSDYCQRHPDEASLYGEIYSSFGETSPENMEKLLVGIKNIGRPIQGRDNPINRDGFENMFAQIINEEKENGIEPSYGEPHVWSKEFLDKHGYSSPMLISSKLLMALAVGETNRYMKTEKEGDLYKWILEQKEGSLELDDVIRQSYRINKGDMYKTLLTIENVLAYQWHNPGREKLPFIKRLKPITSGHEYAEDKFGTWYHLFGIMLYGYVENGFKANSIGKIEALGSKILSLGVNKTQKSWMNKQGGLVGSDLADAIKDKSYLAHKSNPAHLEENSYLKRKEDFRDRIYVPIDSAITATMKINHDSVDIKLKDSKKRDMSKCSVDLIPNVGPGLDSRRKDTVNNVSMHGFKIIKFNTLSASKMKGIRGFIKCEGSSETIVFETK